MTHSQMMSEIANVLMVRAKDELKQALEEKAHAIAADIAARLFAKYADTINVSMAHTPSAKRVEFRLVLMTPEVK